MVMGELPVETEVLVIGGGPGGYAAAFRAADLGHEVTLVNEEEKLGGVCLLRGCIPSKTLLHAAELILATRSFKGMGVDFGEPEIDLDALRSWKESVVEKLSNGVSTLCEQRGVHVVQARATLEDEHAVRLEDSGETPQIQFEQAIIATGSRPIALPGSEFKEDGRIMDSAGALALAEIPETLLVVGGGYVGLEMGQVYATLGSRVTVVEMTDRLLPTTDEDLVKLLADDADNLFEAVHLNTEASDLDENDHQVRLHLKGENNSEASFDRVLVAIGRRPNTDDLGLEEAGVEIDDDGFIAVDEQRRTEVEHIFAVGDVTGGLMLAHEAMREGKVAAEVIAGEPAAFDARAVPAVVYTDPQIAWCGLTEMEAEETGRAIQVDRFPWKASGRALSMGDDAGVTKLISDPDSGRVLGMGITGKQAEAMIAEAVLAIEMGARVQDLALIIHPHPTLSETVGEAAESRLQQATHYFSGSG